MAERAGVDVPSVDRVVRAGGDTALLVMEWVDGSSLEQFPAGQISDDLLVRLWAEVDKLHRARNRPSLPAGRERDGQQRRASPGSSTSVSPSSPPRSGRWTWTWRNCSRRWPPWPARTGRCPPRRRLSAPREWRRRCRCCSRLPCPPPPAARSSAQDGLLARTRAAAADRQRPEGRGTGPPAAGAAADSARHRRAHRRVLPHPSPAGAGRRAAGTPSSRPTGRGCSW